MSAVRVTVNGQAQRDDEMLLSVYECLVLRALEKAGNRIINNGRRGKDRDRVTSPIEAHLSYDLREAADVLLADAFALQSVVLEPKYDADLEAYCTMLFRTRQPHSRDLLKKFLEER